jgi:hypothetical protein
MLRGFMADPLLDPSSWGIEPLDDRQNGSVEQINERIDIE